MVFYVLMPCIASSSGTPEPSLMAQITLKHARLIVFLQAFGDSNSFRPAAVTHFAGRSLFTASSMALS